MAMIRVLLTMMSFFAWGIGVYGQGIQFQQMTLPDAQERAIQQNKLLFIDFHTSWCGPCKILARDIFTDKQVGEYFNSKFVCIQLDAEKEGKDLADRLEVHAYPTLMFIDGKGNVIYKYVGSVGVEKLLEIAHKAETMKVDPNSYGNLKKAYPQHRTDEAFLLNYICRMKEFSENPGDAIEDYLKVQRTYKEGYAEVMEFLLANSKYLLCGGKAEEIFLRNETEYKDIATRSERRRLEGLYTTMINNTYRKALATKDANLYKIFMERWRTMPEKPYWGNYTVFQLELLSLQGEEKKYVKMAERYLDSLTTTRTAAEVHLKDSIHYARYCENNKQLGTYAMASRMANKDLDANLITTRIVEIGNQYLDWSPKRKSYKKVVQWISFGKQLLPQNLELDNLSVKLLQKQGRMDEAIALKEKLLAGMQPNDRGYAIMQAELEEMKNNH